MRLIDADALNQMCCDDCGINQIDNNCYRDCSIWQLIEAQPTIEAEPVVHGEWVWNKQVEEYECSVCHDVTFTEFDYLGEWIETEIDEKKVRIHAIKAPNYCKKCGAKMDGDKE